MITIDKLKDHCEKQYQHSMDAKIVEKHKLVLEIIKENEILKAHNKQLKSVIDDLKNNLREYDNTNKKNIVKISELEKQIIELNKRIEDMQCCDLDECPLNRSRYIYG